MNIYLIRHGETDWNDKLLFQGQTDIELNGRGRRQAASIGRWMKNRDIKAIYSSDLKRAFETAVIMKKKAGIKCKIIRCPGLRERHYGSLEGAHYKNYLDRKKFDGERDKVFFPRVKKAFEEIIRRSCGKNIAIVSHGGAVRAIIAQVLGLKNYKRIRLYNASISELYHDEKQNACFVTLVNSVEHLGVNDRRKAESHIKGV